MQIICRGIDVEMPNNLFLSSIRPDRRLFSAIVLIEVTIFFYLIHGKYLVGGHDSFGCFAMQYYSLNNVVNYHEIPLWSPFMTQGSLITIAYVVTGGILQNILLLSGSLLKGLNFLPIFYLGFFVDELLLLTGVWLLGKKLFASSFTVFFVALSIMGSCIWLLQYEVNFHFYYAIPLMIYLTHMFIDSGKWRFLLLAGNLLLIQSFGSPPYLLPVIALFIFLYFLFYYVFNLSDVGRKIKTISFRWQFVFTLSLVIIPFIALYLYLKFGIDQIANYSLRNPDGSTTLDVFLSYGGKFKWQSWLELCLGLSPCPDYNLYFGVLSVPFIITGLIFNLNRKNAHFLLTTIFLLLFSMGTFVSVFLYFCWPMMKYYRHLVLVFPLIKILLCFLAGFGFDALLIRTTSIRKRRWQRLFHITLSLCMICLCCALLFLGQNIDLAKALVSSMIPKYLPHFIYIYDHNFIVAQLHRTAIFSLTAAVLFIVLSFVNQKKYILFLGLIFIIMHGFDIYGFKLIEIKLNTVQLDEHTYKITDFTKLPYAKRRDLSFWANNPRSDLLKVLPAIINVRTINWTCNALLFKDQLGSFFRTDFWMSPLDDYMKAYWGQNIDNISNKPLGLISQLGNNYFRLEFPKRHPAALKISGATEDKIQFFSYAKFLDSEDIIASQITNPDYKGDIIFLSPLEKSKNFNKNEVLSGLSTELLSADKRLHLPYRVELFDSNNIMITTDTNLTETTWLMYSDVWHPMWRATVNGKETPVYKANLAYKAVKLEKGHNEVHFYFKSRLVTLFHYVFGINALFWLIYIFYLAGKIAFGTSFSGRKYGESVTAFEP